MQTTSEKMHASQKKTPQSRNLKLKDGVWGATASASTKNGQLSCEWNEQNFKNKNGKNTHYSPNDSWNHWLTKKLEWFQFSNKVETSFDRKAYVRFATKTDIYMHR